ncbi:hypothetical protein [uncultured Gilvimarinus sp.]|uniref:hypothetical protein n=1 Tax=uncultured Gilvimarinus sp. TaxID=1689143 RepID=UPI0030D88108
MSEQEQLLQKLDSLTETLQSQALMIGKLIESNAALMSVLVEYMADDVDSDEGQPGVTYLSDLPSGG